MRWMVPLILAALDMRATCLLSGPRRLVLRAAASSAAPAGAHQPVSNAGERSFASRLPECVLTPGKSRLFKDGNPLVYGGAVAQVRGEPADAALVDVLDHRGNYIGTGVYNSASMYRVRLLKYSTERALADVNELGDIIARRMESALALRKACQLPNKDTTCYRLVNGEGDRLSGLVVDVYGKVAVVSSSALWVEVHMAQVEAAVAAVLSPDSVIVWRRSQQRLWQDGWLDRSAGGHDGDDVEQGTGETKSGMGHVTVNELGLSYAVYPELGQKTGFYCDQRDNRALVRSLSAGRTVLDLFCYSGGFALNAAAGGCLKAVGVDSSELAIKTANENAQVNGFESVCSFARADVMDFLKAAIDRNEQYDLVILDPPKLAPNRKALPRALPKYKKLNAMALKVVKPGGLLLTCSCSSAMTNTPGEFMNMVQTAAKEAGRQVLLLKEGGASMDHPVSFAYEESSYLTAVLVGVSV